MGERDIHRRPFEACDIPLYDSANELHREIAAVSAAACTELLPLASKMPVPVAQARKFARGRPVGECVFLGHIRFVKQMWRRCVNEDRDFQFSELIFRLLMRPSC